MSPLSQLEFINHDNDNHGRSTVHLFKNAIVKQFEYNQTHNLEKVSHSSVTGSLSHRPQRETGLLPHATPLLTGSSRNA